MDKSMIVCAATVAFLFGWGGATHRVLGETVRFQTSDGLEVVGDFMPSSKSIQPAPAVILLHMYGSDRSSWAPLIKPRVSGPSRSSS